MACFNLKAFLTIALIAALLSGCGAMSKKDSSGQDAPDQTAAVGEDGEIPIEIIPNPYLQQNASAPAAAKNQFNQAQVAMQSEDWATAERILQTMTQNYPTLSGPFVNLGIINWRQNKLEQAEQFLTQAITVNPLNNDAYNQLGVLLREQGRFTEAETWYKKALEVWPHSPDSLRNLGILYDLYMGKFDLALANYELALKVSPEPSRELQGWIIDLKRRMQEGENS